MFTFHQNHEMNNKSSYEMKNNTYRFTWDIETWDYTIYSYRERKKLIIRSPVFIAKCLAHTSWFITISLSESNDDHFVFSLHRNKEDEGAEIVPIQWSIEVTEDGNKMDFQKEDIFFYYFKKGGSSKCGNLTVIKRHFTRRTLKVICEMSKFFLAEKSILEIVEARTKKINCSFNNLINKETHFGPEGTKYEFSFHATNSSPLCFKIHRIDNQICISCYLLFFIKIFQEDLYKEKLICSGEIDHMHQAINSGDIIRKSVSNLEFTSHQTGTLSAKVEYICTVISNKETVKTAIVTNGNSAMKTLNVIHENDLGSSPKSNSLDCNSDQMNNKGVLLDVTPQVGSEAFKSNKHLLSSSVFSNTASDIETITDVEVWTLSLLLKFMYTNGVDELDSESALKLLLAAEKYQILSLKEMCSAYLTVNLSEKNVCDILITADMAQDNGLKASAIEYVKKYAHKILNSESWKQLVASNASVAAETLGKISFDMWTSTTEKLGSCATSTSDSFFGNITRLPNPGSLSGTTSTSAIGTSSPAFSFKTTSTTGTPVFQSSTPELTTRPVTTLSKGALATSTNNSLFGNTIPFQSTGSLYGTTSTSTIGTPSLAFSGTNTTRMTTGPLSQSSNQGLTTDPVTNLSKGTTQAFSPIHRSN